MIDNEKIIVCDWNEDGGSLDYDISHLHSDLGMLTQTYRIDTTDYEGKRIYQSSFFLFGNDSEVPGDFSYLPSKIKQQLWDVIFAVKRKFFADYQPAIVEHFVDGAYSLERRYELYRSRLAPPGYRIDLDKTTRNIIYQKQEGGPASNGGPPSF